MSTSVNLDWLWYVLAGVTAVVGVVMLRRGVWGDPERSNPQRRRCPKCWYDMKGVPSLMCPECGKAQGDEKALKRKRRRWPWITAACVLLVGAYVAGHVPAVRARSWWAMVPRPVLLVLYGLYGAEGGFDNNRATEPHGPRAWELTGSRGPGTSVLTPFEQELLFRYAVEQEPPGWLWPGESKLGMWAVRRVLGVLEPGRRRWVGERISVLLRGDAVALKGPAITGAVVFKRASQAYANAGTFRVVCSRIPAKEGEAAMVYAYAFRREDGGFRFEVFDKMMPGGKPRRPAAVWGKKEGGYRLWGFGSTRSAMETYTDPKRGVGVSRNILNVHEVDFLGELFREPVQAGTPTLFEHLGITSRWDGLEVFDGRTCHRISWQSGGQTVLIDAESYLIRQDRSFQRGTTTYRPEVEVPIEDAVFASDPDNGQSMLISDPDALLAELRKVYQGRP